MRHVAALVIGVALLAMCTGTASAQRYKYPPGPPYRSCPDTLLISIIQNPDTLSAPCHPAATDTVWGVRGIITGFDARASAYGFYMEEAAGGSFTGVDVFTGATNYNGAVPGTPTGGNLALGDLVVVYGTTQEFPAVDGETEIEGPDAVQSTNDIIIRKISSGNPLPPFKVGTVHDFNWVPSSPGNLGERNEGCLVKIRGPLKVGRTTGLGLLGNNWMLTTVAPSTDSVMVDGFTLCVPAVGTPPVGTVVDSVQGILNQRTSGAPSANSYRIQLRNGNDFFTAAPPNLVEAFPIEDNIVRVTFDRNVDVPTAENAANYSLGSEIDGSTVDNAVVVGGSGQVVDLTITSVRTDGDIETITSSAIGSASCPACLSSSQSLTFINGVITIPQIQAPDPAQLPVFDDRSRFAGPGTSFGNRLTFRGVATQSYGSLYYIEDAAGGARSGVSIFGPTTSLQAGHQYLIAGRVQEFGGETEVVNTVYIVDEGVASSPPLALQSVAALSDTATDQGQGNTTGEDYEGVVVRVQQVRVVNFNTPPEDPAAGGSFRVVQPVGAGDDTILVSSLGGHFTFDADDGMVLNVNGVLHQDGTFRILPRNDADIEFKSGGGFTLDPEFDTRQTGTNHTVIARLLDSGGLPVVGASVTFTVTAGPNAGHNEAHPTGGDGRTSMTISSATAGTDVMVASNATFGESNVARVQWFAPTPFETCNGVDDDGDGNVDEGFPDRDGDQVADCIDPDDDNDGVADGEDNCPFSSNPLQEDSDHDGIGDACDSAAPPIQNPPSGLAINIDGQFGPPTAEWFGTTPATFLNGDSKVYSVVNQAGNGVELMYDVKRSTTPLAIGDRVGPISFQIGDGSFFDVFIIQGGANTNFGPNPGSSSGGTGDQVEVYLNTAPYNNSGGCVQGAVDFNTTSPNYGPAHNLYELAVRRVAFNGGCYYDGTAFWSATFPTVTTSPAPQEATAGSLAPEGSRLPNQLLNVNLPQMVSAAFLDLEASGQTTVHPLTSAVTGVGGQQTFQTGLRMAGPNPFEHGTAILLSLATAQEVDVSIADVSGRIVWRTPRTLTAAGQHRIPWYGTDGAGRRVSPGMYFMRVRVADQEFSKTLVRLR